MVALAGCGGGGDGGGDNETETNTTEYNETGGLGGNETDDLNVTNDSGGLNESE